MIKHTAGKRLFLIALIACLAGPPVYGATKQDVDNAKGKIDSLEEEKKRTEQAIRELEGLKQDTESYVRELDRQLDALHTELDRLEGEVADKEQTIEAASVQLAAAQETEREQYASMKLRIKYMYERGDESFWDLLLTSKSMSELLNRAEYISKISEYDRKMLDQYIAVKNGIAEDKAALEREREELLLLEEQTMAKQESVETLVGEKTAELQKYAAHRGADRAA